MFFAWINKFFSYKIQGVGNEVYVVKNGKKTPLKGKIKGLEIFIQGHNNYIEIEFPIEFKDSKINIMGNQAKFVIKNTTTPIVSTIFDLRRYSEIYIDEDSRFNAGKGYIVVNNNQKNKPHKIVIGKGVQIGSELLLRTSDGHSIFNCGEQLPYNEPQDVIIGDNCWIGARCTILKGAIIPSNSIIGACSLLNRKFSEENTIIAGNPAKVIKRNVSWDRTPYGTYVDKMLCVASDVDLPITRKIVCEKIKRKIKRKLKIG